jgi:hypothetical protein
VQTVIEIELHTVVRERIDPLFFSFDDQPLRNTNSEETIEADEHTCENADASQDQQKEKQSFHRFTPIK